MIRPDMRVLLIASLLAIIRCAPREDIMPLVPVLHLFTHRAILKHSTHQFILDTFPQAMPVENSTTFSLSLSMEQTTKIP